jgi:hypothetical protein
VGMAVVMKMRKRMKDDDGDGKEDNEEIIV